MIGAIAGDIIGSVYEPRPIETRGFPLFHPRGRCTDDTVLTVAVARAILEDGDYRRAFLDLGRRYPNAGYGASFMRWLHSPDPQPYGSWGNGAAMRVSPVGFAFHTEAEVLAEAARSAAVTHDHPEGIKGAQATALAVFLARITHDKALIKREISARFGYDLSRTVDAIRPDYTFDISCQGTVPEAIVAFLDAHTYEDAVCNAVSLGGDSDTLACITGGIAEAYYGKLDSSVIGKLRAILPADLWEVTERFGKMHRPGMWTGYP
jgi:ADP-ribosylglycohydrolase